MSDFSKLYQSADWKTEKHVPVIDAPDTVKRGVMFSVSVTVGKGIPHPNKTDHHISWVDIYFHSAAEKFPYQIARAEFAAHEASVQGADTGSVYTQPEVTVNFKTDKSGVIYAASYCNIHGIWQNSKDVAVE